MALRTVHVTSLREKTELKGEQETSWYAGWESESNSHNKELRRDDQEDKENSKERAMKDRRVSQREKW